MRQGDNDFPFGLNFNFGTESVFTTKNSEQSVPFPPVSGDMDLLDGTDMLLLDGTSMLYL
jgi:hypothetical protein